MIKTKQLPAVFMLISFILLSCESSINTPPKPENAKKEIAQTIDNWHQAAGNSNFQQYFDLMDDNAVFVGTDSSEVWTKKAFMKFAKPYFDKGKAWNFKKIKRHIYTDSLSPNTAWFDETLNTWMGVCRGSGVLQYKNNRWLIEHYVLSLTVPNDKINSVIRVIKTDSLKEK